MPSRSADYGPWAATFLRAVSPGLVAELQREGRIAPGQDVLLQMGEWFEAPSSSQPVPTLDGGGEAETGSSTQPTASPTATSQPAATATSQDEANSPPTPTATQTPTATPTPSPSPTATPTENAPQSDGAAWWDSCYAYRRSVELQAGSQAVSPGYTLFLTVNHAAMVGEGKARADGEDLRIVRLLPDGWAEVDRVLASGSQWNTTNTTLAFRHAEGLSAGEALRDYYLYYGCPGAAAAPEDPQKVFLIASAFNQSGELAPWTDITLSGSSRWFIDEEGVLRQESDDEYSGGPPAINFKLLYKSPGMLRDLWVEYDFKPRDDDLTAVGLCSADSSPEGFYVGQTQELWFEGAGDEDRLGYWAGSGDTDYRLGDFAHNNWYRVKAAWTSSVLHFWFGGSLVADWPTGPSQEGYFCFALNGMGGLHLDNLIVRRYMEPEPVVSLGGEEAR